MFKIVRNHLLDETTGREVSVVRDQERFLSELNDLSKEGYSFSSTLPDGSVLLEKYEGRVVNRRRLRDEAENPQIDEVRGLRRQLEDAEMNNYDLRELMGPEAAAEWDRLREFVRQSGEDRLRAHQICRDLAEALLWCSGAADFAKGAPAAGGWEKGPRVALDAWRAYQNGQ